MRNWANVAPISVVVVVSVVLGLPMLLHGPLVDGHDSSEHLNYMKHFSDQFWQGNLYPRWLIDMNKGLGSASYFVYPPLSDYACVLLEPAAKLLHFNAFNVAAWLSLLGSGITALLWLQTFVSKRVATACSSLYMLMPYHLAINLYRRCDIPECWGFVWMPLLLYFTLGIIAGRRRDLIGFSVAFALMIFSHVVSVAMFFWIPICLGIVLSVPGRKARSAIRVVLAMGLGTGISAVYLLSALNNAKYIPVSRLMKDDIWDYQLGNQLVFFGRGLFVHRAHEYFLQTVSWAVVSMAIIVVTCGTAAAKWERRGLRVIVMFWIAVCSFSVLMMSKVSWPLWDHVHLLHEAVQFPWRLNGILCIGALALIAIYLSRAPGEVGVLRVISLGVLILVIGAWLFAYGNVWRRYKVDVAQNEDQLINDDDGWLRAWIAPGTSQRAALNASFGPKTRFKEGIGSTQLLMWKPRQIEIETNGSTGGWVMINQLYYPTWKAELIDQGGLVAVRPAVPEGLLEVQAPPGNHRILIHIPVSLAEYMGRWLSILSILLCVALGVLKRVAIVPNDGGSGASISL
jgi:hypothetical protein